MPRITEERRLDRKRQIGNAAMRCFVRKGFEATSIADIINEAGISAGALYGHFESKDDLIRQVVEYTLSDRSAALAGIATRDPLPRPSQLVREFVGRVQDNAGPDIRLHVWSTCLREPPLGEVMAAYATTRMHHYTAYFRAWLGSHGLDLEAAEPLAMVLIGICQGYIVQASLVPSLDDETYLRGVEWLDSAGLGARQRESEA